MQCYYRFNTKDIPRTIHFNNRTITLSYTYLVGRPCLQNSG